MSAHAFNPVEVASASGIVIAEDGPRVLVLDRRLGGLAVTAFVLGLIAFIVLANGVIFVVIGGDGSVPPALGWALLATAIPLVGAFVVVWRQLAARRRVPLVQLAPVMVFDRATGAISDARGAQVGRLDQVVVRRQVRLGSSSPALVARFPDRTVTLGKGNPFLGGLARLDQHLDHALRRR